MQGCVRFYEFGLGAELMWDARQSASLEAKVLRKQVTYGLEIF